MAVKDGDKIKVEYTGTLEDGTVFDSSETHGEPLEFEVGSGQIIKGFDDAVKGMEIDQEKDIKLLPADAYGDVNAQLIQKVPKDQMPKEAEITVGMTLGMSLPTGQQIPAMVTEITDTEVTIDINHPLAGKTLNFKIKVVGIE
ncbi:MAG: peptidylprolyl isomerase [DPANN group archaeon]|nr:peptidylprolyl isomerase [DPANN group archaeon]